MEQDVNGITQKERATLIWNEYKDQNDWQRHNELQRATLSTILLSISAALLAIYQKGQGNWQIPLLLIFIGMFGAIAVMKYWERFCYHAHQERAFRSLLDSFYPEGDFEKAGQGERLLLQTREAAKAAHGREWQGWRRSFTDSGIMQHWLWLGVFALIMLIGSVLWFGAFSNHDVQPHASRVEPLRDLDKRIL